MFTSGSRAALGVRAARTASAPTSATGSSRSSYTSRGSRSISTSSHPCSPAASTKSAAVASAPRQVDIPLQRPNVTDPKSFLQAISRGKTRQLQDNSAALTALGETWEEMWSKVLNGTPKQPAKIADISSQLPRRRNKANAGPLAAVGGPSQVGSVLPPASPRAGKDINRALRSNGVAVKDRRYILWALEKYRQGRDPVEFSIRAKPKKKIRGWGPRVQNGVRVRGRRRPGEK
ncbi:hypothetical protein V8E36_005548 [Tilletia maclaganii]